MTRGSQHRESHLQPERPAPPPAPAAGPGADGPAAAPASAPKPVSPGWSVATFLWITAFVVLSLFELLSALFRR